MEKWQRPQMQRVSINENKQMWTLVGGELSGYMPSAKWCSIVVGGMSDICWSYNGWWNIGRAWFGGKVLGRFRSAFRVGWQPTNRNQIKKCLTRHGPQLDAFLFRNVPEHLPNLRALEMHPTQTRLPVDNFASLLRSRFGKNAEKCYNATSVKRIR